MEKMILTVAPTGNVPTKELNPFTPISPEEIAEDILKCEEAGASVAHIHARSMHGSPTCRREVYEEILSRVRKAGSDIVLQVSTGARGGQNTAEGRGQMLDLPLAEMASLSVGSSNFAHSVNANSPDLIAELADKMYRNGLMPELECFDVSMAENTEFLLQKGILREPLYHNLVLNVPGSIKGTPENLRFMLSKLPKGAPWNMTSIGKSHEILVPIAIELGGNVRTGIEDVPVFNGKLVTNTELVSWAREKAQEMGRELATPQEARKLLGLVKE